MGQHSKQEAEDAVQIDQQTVGNEVNQTEQQQDTGEQGDQQTGQQVEQQDK